MRLETVLCFQLLFLFSVEALFDQKFFEVAAKYEASPVGKSDDYEDFVIVEDYEKYANQHLGKNTRDYYNTGAMYEQTLKENRAAFFRLRLRPRYMRDVSVRDLRTTLLGNAVSLPVAISPTATHKLAHSDGEIGTATAAAKSKTIMVLSIYSSTALERVREKVPDAILWLQLHIFKDRNFIWWLVKRAEHAGYKALVLTVDFPTLGKRVTAMRDNFDFPSKASFANLVNDTNFQDYSPIEYSLNIIDPGATWLDLKWLTTITYLPVVVKGILTEEDAEMAVRNGAAAILVSNHGGRQYDGVPATIEALPEVVRQVQGRVEVYMDGGIRTGTDVLKALALGAKAVFIGRPAVWGLASKGWKGVHHVLEILRNETDMSLAFSGCSKLSDINAKLVIREEMYRRAL